jgi:hypothetical protein
MGGSDILFSLALTIINVGSVGNAPGTGILLCCILNSVYLCYSHGLFLHSLHCFILPPYLSDYVSNLSCFLTVLSLCFSSALFLHLYLSCYLVDTSFRFCFSFFLALSFSIFASFLAFCLSFTCHITLFTNLGPFNILTPPSNSYPLTL